MKVTLMVQNIEKDDGKIKVNFRKKNSIKYKVLIIAVFLLIATMLFGGFVNYMTFTSNYNDSLAKTYSVAGNEIVRKIEYALLYGKPIDNYYGMNKTLSELQDIIVEADQIYIVSDDGEILYNTNDADNISDELSKVAFDQVDKSKNMVYITDQKQTYVYEKIIDSNGCHIASLVMVFPENTFIGLESKLVEESFAYLLIIAMIAFLGLYVVIFKMNVIFKNQNIDKKKLLIILILILGLAQVIYSGTNYFVFKSTYTEMAYKSSDFVENVVGRNIETIYSKGLELDDVSGIDDYINLVESGLDQIEEIEFFELEDTNIDEKHVVVNADISQKYIKKQLFRMFLDMLTILVISVFFMIELILMATNFDVIERSDKSKANRNASESHRKLRALIFFINICACMSLTFISIVMEKLYLPIKGFSKDVVLGLPLSIGMFGGIIAILCAGWSIDKKGWKSVFYTGALILIVGNIASGMSNNGIQYIGARGISGFGLGYILMVLRSIVVSLPQNNLAISEFSAGSIAGLNCGAVMGGLLADSLGYNIVFYISAIIIIFPIIFVYYFIKIDEVEKKKESQDLLINNLKKFFKSKRSKLFILCIFIPYFISGAFLDYYFPLFASQNNLMQSDISRGFLLNGLFVIYLGPPMTKYVVEKLGSIKGIILSILIVFFALLQFVIWGSLTAAFVTVIILGIAESFGVSIKTTYFLELNGIRDLEISKGVALFGIMVNFGRMIGPIVYGLVLSFGMQKGIGMIDISLIVLLIIFLTMGGLKNEYNED
jgi:predicted MFS family arabinose efflux permease